jgi:hypothetical protein
MASGGKGGKKGPSMQEQLAAQQQAIEMSRPKPVDLQTSGWGGMGVNAPANPMQMGSVAAGQGLGPPAWAKGDWEMPWWGQQAPNVGAAMMQQQNPQAYGAAMGTGNVAAPQAPQAPQAQQPLSPSYSKAALMNGIRRAKGLGYM